MKNSNQSFEQWLEAREGVRVTHAISEIRSRIYENAWSEDRICYISVRKSCLSCGPGARPSHADWKRHIAEQPLTGVELLVIGARSPSQSGPLIAAGTESNSVREEHAARVPERDMFLGRDPVHLSVAASLIDA